MFLKEIEIIYPILWNKHNLLKKEKYKSIQSLNI